MSHQFLRQGLSLKCRNALGLDFTALTYLCFSVALSYMYIVQLEYTCSNYHWTAAGLEDPGRLEQFFIFVSK